ncbi:MAG: uL15 family ribosomal protein [Clostridiales bacterium]|nr:uL15 family ribosomal protein [Clostridiales bacterium]
MKKEKTPLQTGVENPNAIEDDQNPNKRERKTYKDPVIIFVKPWLKPKIKEKKNRVKAEPEPAAAPQPPKAKATEKAVKKPVAPPPQPQEEEAKEKVTIPHADVVPETLVNPAPAPEPEKELDTPVEQAQNVTEEPAPEEVEEVKEPELENDADEEPAQDESVTETAAADDMDEADDGDEDDVDNEDNADEADNADEVDDDDISADDEADVDDEVTATVDGEADADDEAADTEDEKEEETVVLKPVTEGGKTEYIVIKYSRSFLAKLIQSDETVKQYYSELKNKLLSYRKVKSRISWKCESFRIGRKTIAKLRLRGKTLSLCFVGNPDEYVGTKYAVESLAEVKSYAATPCMYRIRSNRRLLYAKQLIEKIAAQNGLIERATEQTDYAMQYPYETTDALVERKLIKILTDDDAQSGTTFKPSEVRAEVAATEVDKIMSDEVAVSLIEKSERSSDRTKQGIINIDMLSQHFDGGEVVTLAEIKKRIKGFNKKTTYLKVLARGTLDKPLTVEADNFSLQAVKMIVLTGGKVIKKQ